GPPERGDLTVAAPARDHRRDGTLAAPRLYHGPRLRLAAAREQVAEDLPLHPPRADLRARGEPRQQGAGADPPRGPTDGVRRALLRQRPRAPPRGRQARPLRPPPERGGRRRALPPDRGRLPAAIPDE